MHKVGLSLGSSFEKLFHTILDPSKLHVFSCLCFPWLRPYSSHKLNPKSSLCAFLGYSLTQSAFLCFDPTLKKKKNPYVPSCQVCGECFIILFLFHHRIVGNKHRLYSPCLLAHLERPSSTVELNIPPEYFPITSLDLSSTSIPPPCIAELNRPQK